MSRLMIVRRKKLKKLVACCSLWINILYLVNWYFHLVGIIIAIRSRRRMIRPRNNILDYERKKYMHSLVYQSDDTCLQQLRMNRSTFVKLCGMLEIDGKLKASRHLQIDEQVAIFIYILAHHVKNRVAKFQFHRSGETISKVFNNVVNAMIRLEKDLYKKPEPISENSSDNKWKRFKGCLGALDGTHISVHVSEEDKPTYRNRKGEITTNVLATCSPDMQFIYVLSGWEGSAADGRILHSAILRENGLKVNKGNYYLVDAGFTNGEGFSDII